MKLKTLLAVALLAGALVSGCAAGPRELGETDDGLLLALPVGETFTVELESNPSTGYSWQVIDLGPCEQASDPEYLAPESDADVVGAASAERLSFTRVGSEAGALVLEYRRPWEDASIPAEKVWSLLFEPAGE